MLINHKLFLGAAALSCAVFFYHLPSKINQEIPQPVDEPEKNQELADSLDKLIADTKVVETVVGVTEEVPVVEVFNMFDVDNWV
jgi:hypothetical protein